MYETVLLTEEMTDFLGHCKTFAEEWKGDCIDVLLWNWGRHDGTRLLWKCSQGHTWQAEWGRIKDYKTWCPRCKIHSGKDYTRAALETLFARSFEKDHGFHGFNGELKLAFEYQSGQCGAAKGVSKKKKLQERQKEVKLRAGEEGVTLINVSSKVFTLGIEELYKFVRKELEKQGFAKSFTTEPPSLSIGRILTRRVVANEHARRIARYEELRSIVETRKEARLIEESWLGRNFQYSLICKNGHRFKMFGYDILRKDTDPGCGRCVKTPATKTRVKEMVEAAGCTLVKVSLEHKSQNRKIVHMLCPVGHPWKEEWGKFNRKCDEYGEWKACKGCFPTVKGRCSPSKLAAVQGETALRLFTELAQRKGGRVAEPFTYRGRKGSREEVGIFFICARDHRFKLSPFELLYLREWCPSCEKDPTTANAKEVDQTITSSMEASEKKEERSARESPLSDNEEVIYIDDWDD